MSLKSFTKSYLNTLTHLTIHSKWYTGIWPQRCDGKTEPQLQPQTLLSQFTKALRPRADINNHKKVICSAHCISIWHDNRLGTSFNYLQTYVVRKAWGWYLAIIFLPVWAFVCVKQRARCACIHVSFLKH